MRELIIDSFAGGGGASTGIEMALGVAVALVGANYQIRDVVPEAPADFALQAAE
jgi:hypothetical protein